MPGPLDGNGAWSQKGCRMMFENEEKVECACNHLSTFAAIEVRHLSAQVISPI